MGRATIEELRNRRLSAMTSAERAEFDEALAAARLALEVGEKAPAPLLTTLQKAASALGLELTIDLASTR